jgi:hypothetical protein
VSEPEATTERKAERARKKPLTLADPKTLRCKRRSEMKKAYGFLLVAASLLLASGAQAQGVHVRADVPFDFAIGNAMYTSGTYDLETLANSSAMVVKSDEKSGMTLARQCSSTGPAPKTVLIFHRIGDEYVLYQVWTAGSGLGREFPQTKRETILARNNGKSQEITVAALLVK